MDNDTKVPFLSKEDVEYKKKFGLKSFEIKVGLHELLGHGSGKILREEPDGTLNFEKGSIIHLSKYVLLHISIYSSRVPKWAIYFNTIQCLFFDSTTF